LEVTAKYASVKFKNAFSLLTLYLRKKKEQISNLQLLYSFSDLEINDK